MNFYALLAGGYFLVGLILGLYVANEDKKRYGDNRYRKEVLSTFTLIGVPVLIVMLFAALTSGGEDLFKKVRKAVSYKRNKGA